MLKKYSLLGAFGFSNTLLTFFGVDVNMVPIWIISALWSAFIVTAIFLHLQDMKKLFSHVFHRNPKIIALSETEYKDLKYKEPKTLYVVHENKKDDD